MADDRIARQHKPSKRDAASQEIADWLAGSGSMVVAAILLLLAVGFAASIFWS